MMSESMRATLKHLLVKHEGYEKFPYKDTVGKITIGIGYNLTDRGMTDEWINTQYDKDVDYFYTSLTNDYPWFKDLNEERQSALVDMAFNLGYKNFQGFTGMLKAIQDGNYSVASYEMLNSKWATQVKGRATEIAKIMATGEVAT